MLNPLLHLPERLLTNNNISIRPNLRLFWLFTFIFYESHVYKVVLNQWTGDLNLRLHNSFFCSVFNLKG